MPVDIELPKPLPYARISCGAIEITGFVKQVTTGDDGFTIELLDLQSNLIAFERRRCAQVAKDSGNQALAAMILGDPYQLNRSIHAD